MLSRKFRRSILMVLLPLALLLQSCSAMAPSYMDNLKASFVASNVAPGVDHGTLEDVHRLYRNRQYADALEGANFLLQNNTLSYNDRWVEYRESYLLRYRANVALGNYQDARHDYHALSGLEWYEPAKVSGYLAVANALEGTDTSAAIHQLESLSGSTGGSKSVGTSLAGALVSSNNFAEQALGAEASYFQGLIYIQLGDIETAKAHFKVALEQYRQVQSFLRGRSGLDTYVTAADSYLSILNSYLAVLGDMNNDNIASLRDLRADAYYDPVAGGMIAKNWNWDMPFDPFLIDTSATALENWSYLTGEGSERMIANLMAEGKYMAAYATVGKTYRTARMDDTVHQIASILSVYDPGDMTEDARRYLAEANVYIVRRDYSKAASIYLKVIEQSPWLPDAFYNLAHIYAAGEDYSNAIRTMQHFLILSPNGPRTREARDSVYTWEVSAR